MKRVWVSLVVLVPVIQRVVDNQRVQVLVEVPVEALVLVLVRALVTVLVRVPVKVLVMVTHAVHYVIY